MTEARFTPQGKVAVLGSGIVGLCCAIELLRAGFKVDLVDRTEPHASAAASGTGLLRYSNISPMIEGKNLKEMPFHLLRKDGMLFVSKSSLRLLPWAKAAIVSCKPDNFTRNMTAIAIMNRYAPQHMKDLFSAAGVAGKISSGGVMHAYTTKASWHAATAAWESKGDFGVKWSMVAARDLAQMDPSINRNSHAAVIVEGDALVTDISGVLAGLAEHAVAAGANVHRAEVGNVAPTGVPGEVEVHFGDGQSAVYDGCVVAMGAWSGDIVHKLGDKVLLEPVRSYSLAYDNPAGSDAQYTCVYDDLGLVVSPQPGRLLVSGWSEFSELGSPPSKRIQDSMRKKVGELFPALKPEEAGESILTGQRPSTPDSMPVIGPSGKVPGVVYAFGHGDLGLAQSAVTASCVAALASGDDPPCDIAPFGIGRFK